MPITKEQYLDIARANTVFVSKIGSRAYGTHHANSDDDIRCIFVAPLKILASPFETINRSVIKDPSEEDTVYWELGSFLQQAPSDPDMLTALYASPDLQKARMNSSIARTLVENRDALLSQDLIFRLLGHAKRDLKNMERQDKVPDMPVQPTPFPFMFDSKDSGEPYFSGNNPTGRLVRHGKPSQNGWGVLHYFNTDEPMLNLHNELIIKNKAPVDPPEPIVIHFNEREFSRTLQAYRDRSKGPGKTSKRHELFEAHGFDTKQAGSAIRLSRMALELAETGSYNLLRPDAEELKSIILEGSWSADQVREEAQRLKEKAYELAPTSDLPEKPDWEHIEKIYNHLVDLAHPDKNISPNATVNYSM